MLILRSRLFVIVLITALGGVFPAYADLNHYNNILVGDRAAGMAGSYTAISDDTAGLYYNPAGIVYATGNNISGSMNAFNYSRTEYAKVLGSRNWIRESNTLTPNFFGIVQPFESSAIGFSYAVSDSIQEDQDQVYFNFTPPGGTTVNQFNINFNNQDSTYNIGPTYAKKINDKISLGMTLYGHYRSQERILNQQLYFSGNLTRWHNQYFQTKEFGIRPIMGVMISALDKLSLGMSLNKTILLSTNTTLQETFKDTGDTDIPAPSSKKSDDNRDTPVNLNFGAAYFVSERMLVSTDLNYYGSTDNREGVVNAALGFESFLNPEWAVRGGVYTNFANTPDVAANQMNQQEHIDFFGFSSSISRFSRNSALTFGFSYSVGSGDAQVSSNSTEIQSVDAQALSVFMSATYSY